MRIEINNSFVTKISEFEDSDNIDIKSFFVSIDGVNVPFSDVGFVRAAQAPMAGYACVLHGNSCAVWAMYDTPCKDVCWSDLRECPYLQ